MKRAKDGHKRDYVPRAVVLTLQVQGPFPVMSTAPGSNTRTDSA